MDLLLNMFSLIFIVLHWNDSEIFSKEESLIEAKSGLAGDFKFKQKCCKWGLIVYDHKLWEICRWKTD